MDGCKVVFITCKKYEDQSVGYIAKCKTSADSLKKTLASLCKAKAELEAVKSKATSISKVKGLREKRAAITSAVTMISTMQTLLTKAQSLDVDLIGTDSTIKDQASSIASTNTLSLSFTSVQISAASTVVTQIQIIIVKEIEMSSSG